MKKRRITIIGILVFLFLIGFCLTQISQTRLVMNSLGHLIFMPDDLHDSIIFEKFDYTKQSFSKEFAFNPKYYDNYAVSLAINNKEYSGKTDFTGVLKIEIFDGDNKIMEKTTRGNTAKILNLIDDKYWQTVITTYSIPLGSYRSENLKLSAIVIEPSRTLREVADDLYMKVAVSSIP